MTSIEEYRRRRDRCVRSDSRVVETPRARCEFEPAYDVAEVLRRLESMENELHCGFLDSIEELVIERLDQVRRFGLGLSRRISLAAAQRVTHEGLVELARTATGRPNLDLRRGVHQRILQIPVIPAGWSEPAVSAYFVLIRQDNILCLIAAAVKPDGTLAEDRRVLRIPTALAFWRREPVDRFLRDYLRDLFTEVEGALFS